MANLKRILWHILGGTRGGPLRIRILQALVDRPYNTNQLSTLLGADYKTIQHHLRVLTENRIVAVGGRKPPTAQGAAGDIEPRGSGYGATYFPSHDFEQSRAEFDALCAKLAMPAKSAAPAAALAASSNDGNESSEE